ncbi:TonB-linked SusC/RagA family outer membrane protein [Catalinimonas alkaloidigena]|uniref:SusC/RagA family TonB-linked outer membrane protein n=1 Tax=Catalinimonas alkaloidigena TaxID=1075417 RepID=UPI002404FF98|nr:TonB-dependent receptor [Catalinimonas alkaloidigena]MDF9800228.1 TonB-linked SusC/RagA family outer membrane protein [Catalinimonas alkaloidigena]
MRIFTQLRCVLTLLAAFCIASVAYAQTTVSGQVTAPEEGSLPGVNVLVQGTSTGTVTDMDGNYSVSVPEGSDVLVFSSIGYVTQEITINGRSTIDVVLEADVQSLSEVVVIGYGTQEKRDVTGAVSSVSSENFNAGVIASPEQLIQGRAAGVQITQASGEPGAGVNIRIRGTSSVRGGNNPLFVVDGVPLAGDDVSGGGTDVGAGSSSARNPLNFLNPNDIASIDILKDASATAIYGSRGANGVVLITTKTGESGKSTLNYSYNVGISNITKKYDLLNADEFVSAYAEINGLSPGDEALETLDLGADTDWQDEILRTAISHNHDLSYSGGNDNGSYRLSLGYTDQEGIVERSGLRRLSARFNGSSTFIDDRLTISTQVTVSDIRDNNVPISDNAGATGDLLGAALKLNPTYPVYQDGELFQRSVTELNPVAFLELSNDYTNTVRALGNVTFDFKIADGLNFKTVLGGDRASSTRKAGYSPDLVVQGIVGQGRAAFEDVSAINTLMENYFTYNNDLSDNLRLDAVLGYSYQRFQRETKFTQAAGFRVTDLDLILNNLASVNYTSGLGGIVGNSTFRVDELQSFFGRVNFDIADKYLLTATVRADGSTRFGSENRYGVFPSFAAAWRLGDEDFIPEAFTDLKLRAGYGVTGNQEFPSNRYTSRQRYSGEDFDVSPTGVTIVPSSRLPVAFENPDLRWESTTQINIGVDWGFFNNRLRGSLDYYNKTTQDLLFVTQSAQPAPTDFVWENLNMDVINEGFEVVVDADPVDTEVFGWSISANASYNDNRIENYDGLVNTGAISGQGLSGAFAQRIANNQPLFAYYLRPFGGFAEDGQTIYPEGDVQQFVGRSPLPKYNVGFTNNFNYQRLDLSIFFNGQFGQYVYNNTENAYFTAGALAGGNNVTQNVVGNGESRVNAPEVSTRFLEDASFVRLQNLTLGYNFNMESVEFLSSLRLYFTGQNLFVITDYSGQDPEVNVNKAIDDVPSFGIDYTAYPRARTFLFGLNVSF